jgi:hypothetical protein
LVVIEIVEPALVHEPMVLGLGGDAIEPRPERRATVERGQRPPGAHHRLLHDILGVDDRSEHPVAVTRERRAVVFELLG